MSKKKKKTESDGESSSKAFRKLKKKITRLVIIAILVYAAVGVYNPEIIDYPPLKKQFVNLRSQANNLEPRLLATIGWLQNQASTLTSQPINSSVLSAHIENLPEELVVENVISDFSNQVKGLPATQIQRIKAHICEDVIGYQPEDATISSNINSDN